jgi:uncharacterized protein (TIGR03000 family)
MGTTPGKEYTMNRLCFTLIAAAALAVSAVPRCAGADTDKLPISLQVLVPADARLLLDGTPMKATGELRRFVTPPVAVNKDYTYSVTVSVNGMTVTRAVTLRHGAANRFDLRSEFRTTQLPGVVYSPPQSITMGSFGAQTAAGKGKGPQAYFVYRTAPAAAAVPPGAYSPTSPNYALYNPQQYGSNDVTYDPSSGAYRVFNPVSGTWSAPFYRR